MKIPRDSYMNSKIKLPMTIALLFIILLGVCVKINQVMKNQEDKKEQTIEQIAYENNKKDPIVYLKENEIFTPYLVVTSDYNGNVLLVMIPCPTKRMMS